MPARPARSSRWRRQLRWRLRRSPALWWGAAVAAAAVTGITVDAGLSRAAATEARYGAVRRVPVVAVRVAAGAVVPGGGVRMEWRPVAQIPDEPVVDGARGAGRTALVPLVPGEVLLASKVAPDGLRGAAALVPAGMRAIAVPSGPGGRPPLEVRDRVDVLATFGDTGESTVVVAARALVVAVDADADTVTVAVHPEEAAAVAAAVASATVTLALTGP